MNNIFKLKSLKRIVLVLGLLIISFSSLTAFASENKITAGIDKTSYKAGETLKLQLNLKGEKKVSAFIVEAIYPEGVSCSSIEKSSGIKEGFAEIYDSGSKVSFVYTFKNGKALNPQDNILTFKFKVTENIKGENEIKLYIKGVLDEKGEKIFADSSGNVRFTANPPKEAVRLIKLKPSSGSLTPAFSPDVYNYTMSVPYSTESITFEVEYEGEAKASVNRKNLGSGGSVTDFMPLIRIALDFLGDFRRRLRVNRLEMKIILAGDDPCDLAVNYGRACGALAGLEPQLERLFVIRKKDLQVECDFTEDKTLIWARIDLTITLGRLLALAARYGYLAVREFLKIKQLRKGGALK